MKLKSPTRASILFGVILMLAGVASILSRVIDGVEVDGFLSSTIVQLIVFLLPLAFYCRVTNYDVVSGLKFRYVAVNRIPFLVNMTLIFFVGSMLLRYLGLFAFEGAMVETPGVFSFSVKSENTFLHLLGTMILPAILEEVAFRGVLLEEYRCYGARWTIVTTALMFAMLHLSLENFVYYLFMGVVLGVVALATDSLLPAIGLHVLIRISHEYLRAPVVEYLRQAGKSLILPYLLLAVFLLLFIFMFSGLEKIYRTKAYHEILQSRKELLRKELEKSKTVQEEGVPESKGKAILRTLKEIYLSPAFLATAVLFAFLVSDVLKRG